jgi:TPR repeat protein
MKRILARLGLTLTCLLLVAASKVPLASEGSGNGVVYNGHQNMPVQLYGVAIGWDRDCAKGRTAQCLQLGDAFESGLGDLRPDVRVALGYYTRACDQKSGPGCARAAGIVREGRANFSDPALAYRLADSGCTALNDPSACAALGLQLFRGQGAPRDAARAARLLEAACKAGADDGCRFQASVLFYESPDEASHRAAVPLFDAACKQKHAWACAGLSLAYSQGKGVGRDLAAAARYAEAGCLNGQGDRIEVCGLHGGFLTVTHDKARLNQGEQFLNRACQAGAADACQRLSMIGFNQVDGATTTLNEAVYYARRGCDLGLALSCHDLAVAYSNGMQVRADEAVGTALLDRACALGDSSACQEAAALGPRLAQLRAARPGIDPALPAREQLRLAQQAVAGGDRILGVKTVIRLMQEDNEDAEWLLGGWLYYGLDGVFDTSRRADGIILIENAARVGHVDAAIWMGMAYWYGDGVDLDRAKGENYMAIAATRGSEMAAAIYRSMKAEPERQENARRQAAMEEAARQRRDTWTSSWGTWNANAPTWSPAPAPASNWQSFSSIQDQANFNNFVDSASRRASCLPGNPYC